MIPSIGVMVGAYIIVRMLDLISRRIDPTLSAIGRASAIAVKVCAIGTIVVAGLVIVDLVVGSANANMPSLPRRF